jgi:hypothetical protein
MYSGCAPAPPHPRRGPRIRARPCESGSRDPGACRLDTRTDVLDSRA